MVLVHPSSAPPRPKNPTTLAISCDQKNLLVHWELKGFLIVQQTVLLWPCGSSTFFKVFQVPFF